MTNTHTRFAQLTLCVLLLSFHSLCFALGEKTYLTAKLSAGDVSLVGTKSTATLYVDSQDYPGVQRAAQDLQRDIEQVTQQKPALLNAMTQPTTDAVIIGTLGKSRFIDELIAAKKINVSGIQNQWDAYQLTVVQNPTPTIKRALVIVGSNKRGTSYGIYDLSEEMGVSPWYWWADVPVKKHATLYIAKNTRVQDMPKVKYRGIFLNDEAPALTNWVKKNYGNYNHEFYEKVFELLLRLKANYLWPAMWNNAFADDDPQNIISADNYGIVMGTSHHEPMMRADKEWNRHGKGAWEYSKNTENLYDFWLAGAERHKNLESLYTLGMRGQQDEPMSEGENVQLLERIVRDQRDILSKVYGASKVTEVPQLWALYKEVQGFYERGMRVPDDITLLWCDDNWGNIRRLPTPEERKRAGGAGVYYHFDYVGGPRSYRWINTISIAKIWEQMNLAYAYNANQVWIVNVGDLKPMEYPIEFFMRMAWNPEQWPKERIPDYATLWATREFGAEHAAEIAELMTGYTRHNLRRKPELQDENTYSQLHYAEADRVTASLKSLRAKAEALYAKMPADAKDAFFQLVLHPVTASAIVTEMYDMVGKNHLYAEQGRANANDYAQQARSLFKADTDLQKRFDSELSKGKWKHFMDQPHIGYTHWNNPPANVLPLLYDRQAAKAADMGIAIEGNATAWPQLSASVWPHSATAELARFDRHGQTTRTLEVFNKGTEAFSFSAKASDPWIVLSSTGAKVTSSHSIQVSIDWSKAPRGLAEGKVSIKGTGWGDASIMVRALNSDPLPKDFKGFIEADGYVAIEAEHFSKATPWAGFSWQKIPEHGRSLSSMSVFPVADASFSDVQHAPALEYAVYLFTPGEISVDSIFAPTLPFAPGRGLRYAIALDDEAPQLIDLASDNSTAAWELAVSREMRSANSRHTLRQAGAHKLTIYALDPGITLQRLVINTGGLMPSYLGPPESPRQK